MKPSWVTAVARGTIGVIAGGSLSQGRFLMALAMPTDLAHRPFPRFRPAFLRDPGCGYAPASGGFRQQKRERRLAIRRCCVTSAATPTRILLAEAFGDEIALRSDLARTGMGDASARNGARGDPAQFRQHPAPPADLAAPGGARLSPEPMRIERCRVLTLANCEVALSVAERHHAIPGGDQRIWGGSTNVAGTAAACRAAFPESGGFPSRIADAGAETIALFGARNARER